MSLGPRYGVHAALEAEANRLIKESMAGVTSQSAKSDILTPWKEKDRRDREVYSASGTVDPAVRRGMYHRSYNPGSPHLNSRDGHYPSSRFGDTSAQRSLSSLGDFVEDFGFGSYKEGE